MPEPVVFLTYEQIKATYNVALGPDALRAAERRGEFPPRRRLGARRVVWVLSELEAWAQNVPTAEERKITRRAVRPPWAPKLGRPTKAMIAAREAAGRDGNP